MLMRSSRLLAPLVALSVSLAACGSSRDSTSPPTFSDTGVVETTTFNPAFGINLSDSSWRKTPTGVYYRQVIAPSANAATVASGQTVTVNYAGYLVNGQQFEIGQLDFVLDAGTIIPGFNAGVTGMRIGERRLVLIPASQAYGTSGSGAIPPNATLIFVLEVVSAT
jgi:FKBP-type peptidyl-prolyl cis-trans isomerase